MARKVVEKGKEVVTNGNGLGVELKLKKIKVQLGDIKIMVHANKITHPN